MHIRVKVRIRPRSARLAAPLVTAMSRPIYQPIHPAVRPLLDTQYAAFHDEVIQYMPVPDGVPADPLQRGGNLLPGASPVRDVGAKQDFDLGEFRVRAFTPKGDVPENGWPVFLW